MYIYGYFMSSFYKDELYENTLSQGELFGDYVCYWIILTILNHNIPDPNALGKHKVTIVDMSQGYLI